MKPSSQSTTAEARAFRKLAESALYQTYRNAFQVATGLELELCPADEDAPNFNDLQLRGNEFCVLLNNDGGDSCLAPHGRPESEDTGQDKSDPSGVDLRESVVPVRSGNSLMAYLKVRPASMDEPQRYPGYLTILAAFALQLSEEFNRLIMAEENCDPPLVTKAKQYINAHLDEKICLDAVAAYVHVSPYYFCKIFKRSTGMTLTEYVNRRRVERAKRKLLNPQMRVTEVAYDVGYQSLSQFNRSFLKYAGQSPTEYRKGVPHHRPTLAAA